MITLLERWAGVVLMSALDGHYRFGPLPDVDTTKGSVALAIGHFAADTRFVVRETFVGTLPEQFSVALRSDAAAAPLEVVTLQPYLVVVHTDGQAQALAGYARVYELAPHGYAIPITRENRRVPCLREPLPSRRLVFRNQDWEEGVTVGDAIELYRKLYLAA